MAGLDAVLERSAKVLEGQATEASPDRTRPVDRPEIYDADWDEDVRLSNWQQVIMDTKALPPCCAGS